MGHSTQGAVTPPRRLQLLEPAATTEKARALQALVAELDDLLTRVERQVDRVRLATVAPSPSAALDLANTVECLGTLLTLVALRLQERAYDDLGRFAAETVARVAQPTDDPREAASRVAQAFLELYRAH